MTRIVNMKQHPALRRSLDRHHVAGDAVRIDRRTKWGNPFQIGVHGDRAQVIARYRVHLARRIRSGEISLEDLAALKGKVLACWCAPRPCHGDVLARAADWAAERIASAG